MKVPTPSNAKTTTKAPAVQNTPSSGDNNGDHRIASPSIYPGDSDNFILWLTGGSIFGLISGCCCIFICFPPNLNKGTGQKNERFGRGGESRFKDRRRSSKGKFNRFKDECSSDDEEDLNVLQMAPISRDVVGTNDEEFDDVDHKESYEDDF